MHNKYTWVKEQEAAYLKPIALTDNWMWSMYDHLRRSFLYKNSQFAEDNDDRNNRPFKNIVRPILNVQYRTEGFDVKDIELFVNNPDIYYKSFLIKKFHEKWALEKQIDAFIDVVIESFVDYGGVLTKNVGGVKPEVVNLLSLAFCDQTDILSGPFAIKHNFHPQELRNMEESGWGEDSNGATIGIEELIVLCEAKQRTDNYKKTTNSTPGKYIEIYELHGVLPEEWLGKKKEYNEKKSKYVPQLQVIAYYKNDKDQEIGVTLFASKEPELPFKFLPRDKIYGRALGFGGVEELFESQVWTNDNEIKIQEMLELASKTFFKTTDQRFKTRNSLLNSENGQVFDLQQGTDLGQIDTTPRNIAIFNNALDQWQVQAAAMGAAGEALQGDTPPSGTPFKLQELVTIEARGLHKWRQGKIAVFIDEIYRDWVLPYLAKEIVKGDKFMAELSSSELEEVSNRVVDNLVNTVLKERVLNGELIYLGETENLRQEIRNLFLNGGNRKIVEILKDEFKNEELNVFTNIANKQKNLALLTDKLVNVLRQFIATPQIRQDPNMIKLLNTILESSGMSPIMFGSAPLLAPPAGGGTESLQQFGESAKETAEGATALAA